MKPKIFLFASFLMLVAFSVPSCSDYGYADGYGNKEEGLPLDPDLYGTWSFGEGDDEIAWTFNSDGTCVELLVSKEYNWKWGIENEKLKLFVDGGIPAYKTYKIEGDKLYFWVELTSEWSLPLTKK